MFEERGLKKFPTRPNVDVAGLGATGSKSPECCRCIGSLYRPGTSTNIPT